MSDIVISSLANAAMADYPLYMEATGGDPAITYHAQDFRAALDAFVYEGVLNELDFQVKQRQAGANLTIDTLVGTAAVQGDSITRQGKYVVQSTASVNSGTNLTVPGSGTRTHRVVLRIRDKQASGTNYDWTIEVLEDTGSGAPAIPASAISLALVAVPTGSASITDAMITDTRPFARSPRGFVGGTKYPGLATDLLASAVSTTEVYLGMISPVVRVRAGWMYSVRCHVSVACDTSGSSADLNLRVDDGGTHLTGSTIGYFLTPPCGTGNAGQMWDFTRTWNPSVDASLRVALTGRRYSGYGGGTIKTTRRGELSPPQIEISEIGPASLYVSA